MKGFGLNPPSMNQFSVNQSMINAGPFMGTSSGGMNLQGMSQRMGHRGILDQSPQGFQQRFVGPGSPHSMGQQSIIHPQPGPFSEQQKMDSRLPKDKMSLRDAVHQLAMETKNISSRWDGGIGSSGNSTGGMGMNQMSSPQIMEQSRNLQTRYTTESATSILASFGLSNEDLEELSRYPDEQLTPDNMPVILREIRLRKVNRQVPSMNSQGRGAVGDSIQSKVFDYGHSSKFGYDEEPLEARVFNSPMGEEPRKDFHSGYAQSSGSVEGQHTVGSKGRFPVEKSMGFQNEKNQLSFPGGATNKITALDTASGQKIQSLSATQPGLPIEVLDRKYGRNKNQPKMNNSPSLQMGTQQMAKPPSLMNIPPPAFQMANPPPNFQMANPPPNFPIGTPPPNFQMGNRPGLQTGASGSPMSFQVHAESSMRPPNMPPPSGQTSFGKGNWSAPSSQPDVPKTKQLPTPSMMNDYYAASPRIFPHMCSLCNIECKHLKDWIQHQNTNTHIESCRQIRNKYPDWNPQALGALRNEAAKKENQTPRRRSGSGGSSPRHSRSSGSSHRIRRSRSPESFAHPRTRSRSPRRAVRRSPRRSRSPRRRSLSPRKRHSRFSPRDQRTASGERSSSKTRSPERSSETGQTSSAPATQTELNKQTGKTSIIGRRIPVKPGSKMQSSKKTGSDSTSARKSGSDGTLARKSGSDGNLERKPSTSSDGTSKKPLTSSVSQESNTGSTLSKNSDMGSISSKMSVSSTLLEGNSLTPTDTSQKSRKKRKRVRPPPAVLLPPPPPPPKEVYSSLPWFKNKMDPETVIHISDLPDDGYTDQDILKVVQPFGKASDILIVRCKNEAYLEMSFREAAIAAVKFSETVPVMINKKRIRLTSVGNKPQPIIGERRDVKIAQMKEAVIVPSKKPVTTARPSEKLTERALKPDFSQPKQTTKVNPKAGSATAAKVPEVVKSTTLQKSEGGRKGSKDTNENLVRKRHKPVEEDLDSSVILVTNFPEKEYSAEEIANLAKPFGGVKDVVVLSSHKQAYLQMSQVSAESMIKFYTVFPMSLAGKQLSIKLIPKYKSVKDVERIFIDLINAEESMQHPDIHEQFVHLRNLPKEGYTDLEVAYLGLRFGKVTNYVVIRNKRKAILQLDSMKAAKAMFTFSSSYPCCLGSNTLKCTLSPKRKLLPGEVVTDEESDEGSDLENMDETECAQMAYEPPVKSKLSDANIDRTITSSTQMDVSKPEPNSNAPNSAVKGQEVNMAERESEARVITLSSKPLATKVAKLGGIKKRLIKKRSTIIIDSSVKSLKCKRIALQPKLMKKTKLKGKGLRSVVSILDKTNISKSDQPTEEATKTLPRAMSQDCATTVPMVSTEDEPMSNKNETPITGKSEPLQIDIEKRTKGLTDHQKQTIKEFEAMVKNADGKSGTDSEGTPAKNTALQGGKDSEEIRAKSSGTAAKWGGNSHKPLSNSGTEVKKNMSNDAEKGLTLTNRGSVGDATALKGGVEEQKTAAKGTLDYGKSTGKVGVEPAKHIQNRFEKNPEHAFDGSTNKKDQMKVDIKNSSNSRSGPSKKVTPSNDKPSSNPGGLAQKMASAKSGDQKSSSRYETSKRAIAGKTSGKETSTKRPSSRTSTSPHIGSNFKQNVDSVSRRSTGRSLSSIQEKDLRGESRSVLKSQERDRSSTRKDDNSNKTSGRNDRSHKSSTSAKLEETVDDHEMFPFNMDEFVTVDEIVEETVDEETSEKKVEENSHSKTVPESGKRKEPSKETPPTDTNSIRRRGNSPPCPRKQDRSFVTLDEVGDEDTFAAQPEARSVAVRDPQTIVSGTESIAENKRSVVKAPHLIMTLDEVSDEEDVVLQGTGKDNCRTNKGPEDVSKVQPMVKVVEEGKKLATAEKSTLNTEEPLQVKEEAKASGASNYTSSVPDSCAVAKGPEAKVDRDQQALVTLDEFNAEDEDFMHSMDGFSEEHQFVTVDEIGEEEEDEMAQCEETKPVAKQDNAKSTRDEKDEIHQSEAHSSQRTGRPIKRSLTSVPETPGKAEVCSKKDIKERTITASELSSIDKVETATGKKHLDSESKCAGVNSKISQQVKALQEQSSVMPSPTVQKTVKDSTSKDDEAGSKQKKIETQIKMAAYNPKVPVGLEFLIPKTGYFCELCSLFYMDDASKIKHCKTLRHYTCVEKHMTQKQESHLKEESSSTVQEKL